MREDGGIIGMTQKPMRAKDCGRLVEARREAWDGFIFGGLRRNLPCPHLDIGLLPSRILCERVCPRCLHLPGLRGFVTAAPGRQGRQAPEAVLSPSPHFMSQEDKPCSPFGRGGDPGTL